MTNDARTCDACGTRYAFTSRTDRCALSVELNPRPAMKIDQQTKTWIRRELAQLELDDEYAPMIPGIDALVAQWEAYNPLMFKALQEAKLTKALAQVLQAKVWADRDDLELSGMAVTDAREQAERNWYLEPEEQKVEPSPLAELDQLLCKRLQTPLYQ
jgi:hypothetical protein